MYRSLFCDLGVNSAISAVKSFLTAELAEFAEKERLSCQRPASSKM